MTSKDSKLPISGTNTETPAMDQGFIFKNIQDVIRYTERKIRRSAHRGINNEDWTEYVSSMKIAIAAGTDLKKFTEILVLISNGIEFILQWPSLAHTFKATELYIMLFEVQLDQCKIFDARKSLKSFKELCQMVLTRREHCAIPINAIYFRMHYGTFVFNQHKNINDVAAAMESGVMYLNYGIQRESLSAWVNSLLLVLPTCFTMLAYRQSYHLIRVAEAWYLSAVKFILNPQTLDGVKLLIGSAYSMQAVSLLTDLTIANRQEKEFNLNVKEIDRNFTEMPQCDELLYAFTNKAEDIRKLRDFAQSKLEDIKGVKFSEDSTASLSALFHTLGKKYDD